MSQNEPCGISDRQTCLCCMCRCGEHKCPQQLALKLPGWMQEELQFEKDPKRNGKDCAHESCEFQVLPESDLYQKSTYRKGFCEQQDIIDHYPLEQIKPAENLKPFSKHGYAAKGSVYRDDFTPWSKDEEELCRGKLHLPDSMLDREEDSASGDIHQVSEKLIPDKVYRYYCPAHCVGEKKVPAQENCLIGHKDRFNLGPPTKKANLIPEKSRHPFAKFSNYMLDYQGGKISPDSRSKPVPVRNGPDIGKSTFPMPSETSYRSAFTGPPQLDGKPKKKGGQADTLKVGNGPMNQQTTSMLDYMDHGLSAHKPVRAPREIFRPPSCRMETDTTTGTSYPRWKEYSRQEIPEKGKHQGSYIQPDGGVQRLFTVYQADFDGLNSALCPCRVVEKYGPKVLEPRYRYTESEKPHDMFCVSKSDSDAGTKDCPH